jgi:hypothetical protein
MRLCVQEINLGLASLARVACSLRSHAPGRAWSSEKHRRMTPRARRLHGARMAHPLRPRAAPLVTPGTASPAARLPLLIPS